MVETTEGEHDGPPVALWRTWGLRLIFAAMVLVLGSNQWSQILAGTDDWPAWEGLGRSMLAMLALLALAGVFHPLKMLPLMLYEMGWKLVWLLAIALPAWVDGRVVPDIVNVTATCIAMVVLTILIPWRYVWRQYILNPAEPWRYQVRKR